MSNPPPLPPTRSTELQLIQRLLERDSYAPAEFAALFYEPLVLWLQGLHDTSDHAACAEAAGDTMLSFIKNPGGYDPERLNLTAFLRMAARRDLQNVLRKERRHHRNRRDWNVVEVSPDDGKYLERDNDPSLPLQIAEATRLSAPDDALLHGLTAAERDVLELMHQGERRTRVFAEVLGLTALPAEEQRQQVKRVKDRLIKRQQRSEDGHERTT